MVGNSRRKPNLQDQALVSAVTELLEGLEFSTQLQKIEPLLERVEARELNHAQKECLSKAANRIFRIRERLAYFQQRERELLALYDTTIDLSRLRDIDNVLGAIVRRARNLLNSNISYLSVYDADRNDFYLRASDGAVSETFLRMRISREIGTCRYIADTKRPFFSSDYRNDDRFSHDRDIDAAITNEGVAALLGVPLLLDDRILGILFVADRHNRGYQPQEIAILSSLAIHAAIVIENTRLFDETRTALKQVGEANERLAAGTAGIQAAAVAHEQFTALVARGGSLEDLTVMMAADLGGRITVLDEEFFATCVAEPCGLAPAALGPKADALIRRALAESRAIGRSVPVSSPDGGVSRVVVVASGKDTLGSLVIWTTADLSDAAIRIFERGALVMAILLLSRDHAARAELGSTTELLAGLLSNPQGQRSELLQRAGRLYLDLSKPVALLLIDLAGRRASHALRYVSVIARNEGAIAGDYNGHLVLLSSGKDPMRLAGLVQDAIDRQLDRRVTIVLSEGVQNLREFPNAYEAVRRCLKLIRLIWRGGVIAREEELSLYAVLFSESAVGDLDSFVRSTIGPLLDHDSTRGTDLAGTLLAYLNNGHNITRTAVELRIHANTVRQRLGTISSLLRDWNEWNCGFEAHVALRLHSLRTSLRSR
jgi:hypothetical protein